MRLILTNYDYVNINKDVCFLGKWIKKSNDSIVAYHFDNQDFLLNSTDYLVDPEKHKEYFTPKVKTKIEIF